MNVSVSGTEAARGPAQLPRAVVLLTLLWVWIFVWLQSLDTVIAERALYVFGVVPVVLSGRGSLPLDLEIVAPPWTLLSNLLIHTSFSALLFNLAALWGFGRAVEGAMNARRFIALFAFSGVIAVLVQTAQSAQSSVPIIAAGAATSGVLGAYSLLHPRAKYPLRIPYVGHGRVVEVPAGLLILLWFFVQFMALGHGAGGATAASLTGHVVGFVAGGIMILFVKWRYVGLFN